MMKAYFLSALLILFSSCSNKENFIFSEIESKSGGRINLSQIIDSSVLTDIDLDTLRLLRNEIFARHGYIFNSQDLENYFMKYEWYEPIDDNDNITSRLTIIDNENINLIKSIENSKLSTWNLDFRDYLNQLPQLQLPIYFKCDILLDIESVSVPDSYNKNYHPEFALIYGKLYETKNEVAIIYGFVGDFLYFEIIKFDNNGKKIEEKRINPYGGCGDDAGVSAKTTGIITNDYNIETRTVVKTWDYEKENPKIDSTVRTEIRKIK